MILAILLIIATGYCVLIAYRSWQYDEKVLKRLLQNGDVVTPKERLYCIEDCENFPDGSMSLCGYELVKDAPSFSNESIPDSQTCPECLRIERLIERYR